MRRQHGATALFRLIATSYAIAVLAEGLPFKTTGTGTRRVAKDPLDNHVRNRVLGKGKGKAKVAKVAEAAPAAKFIGMYTGCCTSSIAEQTYFCKYDTHEGEDVSAEATEVYIEKEDAYVGTEVTPAADAALPVEGASAAEATPGAEAATAAEAYVTPEPEAEAESEALPAVDAAPAAEVAEAPVEEQAETPAEIAEKAIKAEVAGQADQAYEVEDAVGQITSGPGCGGDGGGRRATSAVIENDSFASKEEENIRRGRRITVKGAKDSGSLELDVRGLKGKGAKESKGGKGKDDSWEGGGEEPMNEPDMYPDDEDEAENKPNICPTLCEPYMDESWEQCTKEHATQADETEKARAAAERNFSAAESAPVAAKAERLSAGYAALIGLSGLLVLVVAFLFLKKRRSSNQGEMMMLDKDLDGDNGTDMMSSNGNVGVFNEVVLAEDDDDGFEFQLGNNRID